MEKVDPMMFIGSRFLLAGLAVLPLAIREATKAQPLKRSQVRKIVILGSVFFVGMLLQQIGLVSSRVTNAGFLTALYVVMVPVISWAVLRQTQPGIVWICATACVFGTYLLSFHDTTDFTVGDLWIIAGSVVWAIHVILLGIYTRDLSRPCTIACGQFFVVGTLGMIGLAAFWLVAPASIRSAFVAPTLAGFTQALPEIIYAGVVSGGVAFTLQAIAQQHTSAAIAAILMSSESLFAAVLGAIYLEERLQIIGYVGCCIILLAIVAVQIASESQGRSIDPAQN